MIKNHLIPTKNKNKKNRRGFGDGSHKKGRFLNEGNDNEYIKQS